MAKIRFDSVNDPILNNMEWTGTPQELLEIYDGLRQRFGSSLKIQSTVPKILESKEKVAYVLDDTPELAKRMPTIDQLATYILAKPQFEHDIVEIEKKFFDKQLNTRIYAKLYRELRDKVETTRKSIEASERGYFERKRTSYRNLPAYVFKKINVAPLNTALGKTS